MSIDVRAHDHIPVRSGLRLRKRARAFSLVGAAGLASVTVAAIFAIGFLSFASDVSAMRQPAAAPKADAIIVLTGGHARIDAAVDLLAAGNARRLLISGVHPDTSLESIRRATGGDKALFACCVDIDKAALNTIGNAAETAKWVHARGYRSVIVVTNNYHMPRSLLEFGRSLDGVAIHAYPVVNTDISDYAWLTNGASLRVLASEYLKYAAARLRSMASRQPPVANVTLKAKAG